MPCRRPLLFLFAVLVVLPMAPERIWAQAWQRFLPPDRSFAVLLPGVPAPPKIENDSGVIVHSWVLRTAFGGYIFSYGDYPSVPNADEEIAATLRTFLTTTKSRARSQRRISFKAERGDALPALEFAYTMANGSRGSGKIVVDGRRVYMWVVVIGKGHNPRADTARYLASIAITAPRR